MQRLAELGTQELLWTPTKLVKKSYDLCAGEEVLGTVRWQRGSLAAAEI